MTPSELAGRAERRGRARPLIVVVDDDPVFLTHLEKILIKTYDIATATNGLEGLEQVRRLRPDLVVTDVVMPGMDGTALCKGIKSDPELDHIPVVAVTGGATLEGKLLGLEVGADEYLSKPVERRELLARIKNLLLVRRQAAELKALNEELVKQVEQEVEARMSDRFLYEKRLVDAKERAEESEAFKAAILTNINHEIRTPVTEILGFAARIRAEEPEDAVDLAARVRASGLHLIKMLDAVLELSDDTRSSVGPPSMLDPYVQVGIAVDLHRQHAVSKGLDLVLHDRPGEAKRVYMPAQDFQRVVAELVENAIKFTREGRVEVRVDTDRAYDGSVTVTVQDTGAGIGGDFLPLAFDAFRQEHAELSREQGGFGIGLAIARHLTERWGGRIDVDSRLDQGSTFSLILPAMDLPRSDRAPATPVRRTADLSKRESGRY